MKKLWFKAKLYGWGWYPSTWEGWLIIFGFVAAESLLFSLTRFYSLGQQQALLFVGLSLVLAGILILICYKKGEKPRWRWGK